MNTFQMMATVLSMVLGLGVTRLLLGLITVFRIRRQAKLDWVPLVWSLCLFLTQLQYWWAINQLPANRTSFSFLDFVSLVILTLALFAASALLLPSRAEDEAMDLRQYFETEGRYALLAMAVFSGLGFLANLAFFDAPLIALWSLLDLPIMALLLVGFLGKSRAVHIVTSCLYLPLLLIDIWVSLSS